MGVAYPVTTTVFITVDHIDLIIVIEINLNYFVLIKSSLGLSHMVPVVIVLTFL